METGSPAAAVGQFLVEAEDELLDPHPSASISGVLGSCATMPPPRLRVAQDKILVLGFARLAPDQLSSSFSWIFHNKLVNTWKQSNTY